MCDINLHTIFRNLVDDNTFLCTIINTNENEFENRKKKPGKFDLMKNIIVDYTILSPYDIQKYESFPPNVKKLLMSPDYVRFGIKNVIEKNLDIINISFLNSLNMLLRPELYKCNIGDQVKNLHIFESFIIHKIQRNYKIDKIKNTKKIKLINQKFVDSMLQGDISHQLIEIIINIFEINLLVFDFAKSETYLYWTKGHKYPYFNLFRDIHCMSFIKGNYEPIFILGDKPVQETMQKIMIQTLININDIKAFPNVSLAIPSLDVINSWNIDDESFVKICDNFFNKPRTDIFKLISEMPV